MVSHINYYLLIFVLLFKLHTSHKCKVMSSNNLCFLISEIHKYHNWQQMQTVPEPSRSPRWVSAICWSSWRIEPFRQTRHPATQRTHLSFPGPIISLSGYTHSAVSMKLFDPDVVKSSFISHISCHWNLDTQLPAFSSCWELKEGICELCVRGMGQRSRRGPTSRIQWCDWILVVRTAQVWCECVHLCFRWGGAEIWGRTSTSQKRAVRHAACHRPWQRTDQGTGLLQVVSECILSNWLNSKWDICFLAAGQLPGELHPQQLDIWDRMHSLSGGSPLARSS